MRPFNTLLFPRCCPRSFKWRNGSQMWRSRNLYMDWGKLWRLNQSRDRRRKKEIHGPEMLAWTLLIPLIQRTNWPWFHYLLAEQCAQGKWAEMQAVRIRVATPEPTTHQDESTTSRPGPMTRDRHLTCLISLTSHNNTFWWKPLSPNSQMRKRRLSKMNRCPRCWTANKAFG